MGRLSKEALLGASDLTEREVELPSIGGSVKVRSLPAAYSNQAQSKALQIVTGNRGEQTTSIDTERLEILQVLHGMVEPKLASEEEARTFAQHCGPAWHEVIKVIQDISGINEEAAKETEAKFPSGGASQNGQDVADAAPSRSS